MVATYKKYNLQNLGCRDENLTWEKLGVNYTPFGVILEGRSFEGTISSNPASAYRFGFNGMERDDEVKGLANHYNFGNRMYDPRLGRFLSMDANVDFAPYQSPYLFANNSPIIVVDVDGNWGIWGAVCGFVGGAIVGTVHGLIKGESWSDIGKRALKYGAAGAVIGGTWGLGTAAVSATGATGANALMLRGAIGLVESIVSGVFVQTAEILNGDREEYDGNSILISSAGSLITMPGMSVIEKSVGRVTKAILKSNPDLEKSFQAQKEFIKKTKKKLKKSLGVSNKDAQEGAERILNQQLKNMDEVNVTVAKIEKGTIVVTTFTVQTLLDANGNPIERIGDSNNNSDTTEDKSGTTTEEVDTGAGTGTITTEKDENGKTTKQTVRASF